MSTLTTQRGDGIVYDDLGPESAPTVLFITGAGPTRADPITLATAEALAARGIRSFFADRLGRGESTSEGEVTLDAQLSAIAELAAVAQAPVILVGHSSGCAIGMLAAPRVPTIAGLVLWEAPLGLFPEGAPAWWSGVRSSIDDGDLEGAVAGYMVGMPPEWLEELKSSPAYPQLVLGWVPDGEALALVEQRGNTDVLAGVTAPVLALTGTETYPGMQETADGIAAAAAHGSAEQLRGSEHSWNPEAMAERLTQLVHEAL
ncbi:alpha/beta fold hydrolase [Microbacterium sp. NPDC057650]|uniref:alpha/beta hydrolase n=1 Tax=unclassified Microbacterium TaxID=2609290 RepID=UPI0036726406